MNRQVAIGLIIGVIVAAGVGYLTVEYEYYQVHHLTQTVVKKELNKEEYDLAIEKGKYWILRFNLCQ